MSENNQHTPSWEHDDLVHGYFVVPGRLLAAGFAFEYPEWPAAARELCARARTGRVA